MNEKEDTAVKEGTTKGAGASSVVWEELEAWARGRVQEFIQALLEEEVTEFLGRGRSERKGLASSPGYRNGHGKPRRLTLSCGTVLLRRPRVRDLDERFESRILPFFKRRTKEVNALLPELYLHGLAEGDFDLALRGLLGDEAPISASTVARLKAKWQGEFDEWSRSSLAGLKVVYLWVDGFYVKAGIEDGKAAVLAALAGLSDGRKVLVALKAGYRESIESWADVLRDLKARGMSSPRLVIGDGHLGIWGALREVYPEADEQRCWNHKVLNVLDKLPKKAQRQGRLILKQIPRAETLREAERLKGEFEEWCQVRGYEEAAATLGRDWERMVAFYRYPKEHWRHLRTTNPLESPFSSVRLRTDAAKRYKKIENATAVIWKVLMVAEKSFRRLNSAELLEEVYKGEKFVNGLRVKEEAA